MKGCSYANVASPFLNIHVSGRLWLWLPWSKMSSHQGMPTSFTFWNLHAHQNFEPSELWQRWADHLSCPVLQPWSYSSLGLDAFEMTWWAPHKGWTTCTSTSCKFRNSGKIWQDYMSWDNTHDWLPICLMCNDLSCWFGSRAAKPVKRMGKPELIIPGIEASSKKRKLKKNMHQAPQLNDWKTHRREVIGSRKCCLFNYIPNMPKPMRHSVTFVLGAQATSIHGTVETSAEATVCWP